MTENKGFVDAEAVEKVVLFITQAEYMSGNKSWKNIALAARGLLTVALAEYRLADDDDDDEVSNDTEENNCD